MRIQDKVYNDVVAEAVQAHEKHGNHSMYYKYASDDRRLAIITEELGEVAKEVNEGEIHRDKSSRRENLRKELIQVAAMAVTWIQAIDDNPI